MLDEHAYLANVDRTLESLRAILLGQNIRLKDILPQHIKGPPAKEQAHSLASQLLFALVKAAEKQYCNAEQQKKSKQWLEDCTRYLLEESPPDDQTFCQLLQLIRLPSNVRDLIFINYLDKNNEVRTAAPPELLQYLDVAIWWLLGRLKKQDSARRTLNTIISLKFDQ